MLDDTIAAIATPLGEGGLAVIRISGPRALMIADASFQPIGKPALKPSAAPTHTVHYGRIVRQGRSGDEVMVAVMRGPRTLTREDGFYGGGNCAGNTRATHRGAGTGRTVHGRVVAHFQRGTNSAARHPGGHHWPAERRQVEPAEPVAGA